MRYWAWMMLAAAVLAVTACGSPEQPPAKSAPPAVTTPAPAPPPAAAPLPAVPPATVAEPPPAPLPAAAPAPPPPPPVPDKPAAAVTEPSKPPAVAPAPAPQQPAAPTAEIPDSVTLAASQGEVTLPHLVHAKAFPCATCHPDGPPGKISLTKDAAHELCRDCHKAKGAGPITCTGCHKK
jgi:hypothetical protein